jgi:hypothetical protein
MRRRGDKREGEYRVMYINSERPPQALRKEMEMRAAAREVERQGTSSSGVS